MKDNRSHWCFTSCAPSHQQDLFCFFVKDHLVKKKDIREKEGKEEINRWVIDIAWHHSWLSESVGNDKNRPLLWTASMVFLGIIVSCKYTQRCAWSITCHTHFLLSHWKHGQTILRITNLWLKESVSHKRLWILL